jgi:L-fuconolactonase
VVTDAHVHLWNPARLSYPWLTPDLAPINRPIEFDQLERRLSQTGVDRAVLVQSAETDEDTDYLLEIAAAHPEIAGVVGWLALEDPASAAERLAELRGRDGFCGVRVGINMEPDADWLLRPDVDESLGLLEEADVPFDVVSVRRRHLELVPILSERHPRLRMVVDHLSKPPIRKDESWVSGWRRNLALAAENPNVYAKVSGLTPARGALDDWTADELRPFVEHAFETFGADRLMFGTDWPVSELAGGYHKVWEALRGLFDELDEAQRAAVLDGTATRFYALDPVGTPT